MEWITGLALLPMLICAGMMFGGMAIVALGLRRTTTPNSSGSSTPTDTGTQIQDRVPQDLAR